MTGSGIRIPRKLHFHAAILVGPDFLAAARENVVKVHRGGGHAQHHLVARRLRIGEVLVQLQAIARAMPDCEDRFHFLACQG